MSASCVDGSRDDSKRHDPSIRRIAAWLGIAAAPTFAAMAILTGSMGGGGMEVTCGAGPWALTGMAPMYLLMSVFHFAPWLKLIGTRLSGAREKPRV
jgi:hypothetical protein